MMIITSLQGGLGNMLFQIATGLSLALDNNVLSLFDIDGHKIGLQGCNGSKYKNNIFRNIRNGVINIENIHKFRSANDHDQDTKDSILY